MQKSLTYLVNKLIASRNDDFVVEHSTYTFDLKDGRISKGILK